MLKYRAQIKYGALLLFGLSLWIPAIAQQQPHGHTPLLDIQQQYVRGEIGVETAALEQFRVLYEPESAERHIHKCATPAFMFLENHREQLSPQVLQKIKEYQAQHSLSKNKANQASYISPLGKFEIFYDTTGTHSVSMIDDNENGVPDYIDNVAFAADSSYRHEVINIGFTDPIPEGSTYKIYVENNLFQGAYGNTEPSVSSPGGTFIRIEADFENFPPNTHPEGNQAGAIYATVAHEFKHAIQYAQNRWRSPSGAFDWAEMDATLMEEVIFDDVNDYYNYIKSGGINSPTPHPYSIFGNPANSVPGAYNYVTWMIYYSEALGNELWRNVWELIEQDHDLGIDSAMSVLMGKEQFEEQFVRNHLWHYASGAYAGVDDYGFEEKNDYPTPRLWNSFSGVPTSDISLPRINKLAARYIEIIPSSGDHDYVDIAIDFDSTQVGLGLLLYLKNGEIKEYISTGRNKAQVYLPTNIDWSDVERAGIVVANFALSARTDSLRLSVGSDKNKLNIRDPKYVDLPNEIEVYQNYPNPFNPVTTIAFGLPRDAHVTLEVYDITGRKVQTLVNENRRLGNYTETFDGSRFSSGIYLYRLRVGNDVFVKKMTLVK